MKKIALFSLLLAMVMALTACGSSSFHKADANKYITLGEYKGLSYQKRDSKITDFAIQTEINAAMNRLGYGEQIIQTVTEGTVSINDILNIDYSGKKDDIAFDKGTDTGASLTIGSGQFIPGFEEKLVGVKVGETVNIELTFPVNYSSSELRGQDVVFEVTVNSITGKMVYPEFTDSIAKEIDEDVKTADELRQKLKEKLEASNVTELQELMEFQLWSRVLSDCSVKKDIPSKFTTLFAEQFEAYYKSQATQYGYETVDDLLTANNISKTDYNAIKKASADAQAKELMIAYAIVKAEDFTITADFLNKSATQYAAAYGYSSVENYTKEVGEDAIWVSAVLDYAQNLVVESAKVE